ncbi:S8 family serine peptidase [Flavobacterium sp. J49]|uniref:S8 family serine peptidase n=1 Tax=Flavobacterium sp. J49 TaxID=2718534 RepID=UPI0015946571|nr:S8 family serine peptidase [Flavobacterium sp. J49]MBF6640318.1 S8 family serine peptidase [Flavobacterium sp. J49]NIC01563.1 S8 family serine peptidase [Flavobacterium sp. J49]
MKKLLLFAFFLCSLIGYAQEDAWVYFNGKPNAQTFLSNPLSMLTQRALDRRAAQGIALAVSDAPIEQSYIDQITAAQGIQVKAQSKWLNCLHVRGSLADIQALSALSFVDHIHYANHSLNARMSRPNTIVAVNKQMDVQTTFAYGNSANQVQMLNAHLLHQQDFTGSGKIIAVMDSGFSAVNTIIPFNRMFNNGLYLGGYNYVGGNTDVFSTHNHGTMTLSCMAGFVDGQLVGTAPDAQYYLFITEDVVAENPVEESYWVQAAEEADRLGVDVITTSLGYFGYDNPSYSYTYTDMTGNKAFASQGANMAFSKGMIVIASAGNTGSTVNPHIGVPAEATNVLAVGSVQFDETYSNFSSIGPSFDGRIKPDVMAKGQSATLSNTSGAIVTASGTSFSCPIMAGAVASFWQAIPWATNQQVVDFVKQSADRFTSPTNQYGYGIPDFQSALTIASLSVNNTTMGRFLVYPNPVDHVVSVSFPYGFEVATMSLYNNLGQMILERDIISNQQLSLEHLTSGMYYYIIKSNSLVQSGKIIKN